MLKSVLFFPIFSGLLILPVSFALLTGCMENSMQVAASHDEICQPGKDCRESTMHNDHAHEDEHYRHKQLKDHDHDHDNGHGHNHRAHENETSDLDRPIADLFADVCEHEILTHQCGECRYEVGVVKVSKNLLDGGLIRTAQAIRQPGEAALILTGEIGFDEGRVSGLSPLVPGIVSKVLVDFGQAVKAGQGLLVVKSVELAQAEAEYLEAESLQILVQKSYERQKSLRDAGVNAERELLEAEHELASAKIRCDAARQKLLRLGLTAGEIRNMLDDGMPSASGDVVLRSPLTGTVLELYVRTGDFVNPGDKTVLVGDLSNLWIIANLYERDLPGVLKLKGSGALPVSVTLQAFQGEQFAGQMDFIGSLMDEKTRTVKTRIKLANPDGRLRPGMFVSVTIQVSEQKEILAVPSTAVLSDEGRYFVFVHYKDDFYVRRPVVKGAEHGDMTDISFGLDSGQKIVTSGAFLLKSDVLRSKMGAGCAD